MKGEDEMKEIAGYQFPENRVELEAWRPFVMRRSLARMVLAVACTRCEGAWSAYIDAVAGESHEREFQDVLEQGTKLSETVARAIFNIPKELPYNE